MILIERGISIAYFMRDGGLIELLPNIFNVLQRVADCKHSTHKWVITTLNLCPGVDSNLSGMARESPNYSTASSRHNRIIGVF